MNIEKKIGFFLLFSAVTTAAMAENSTSMYDSFIDFEASSASIGKKTVQTITFDQKDFLDNVVPSSKSDFAKADGSKNLKASLTEEIKEKNNFHKFCSFIKKQLTKLKVCLFG